MQIILETERLLLREMTQKDYPSLAAILQDSETMYAYEGPFTDEETQACLSGTLSGTGKTDSVFGQSFSRRQGL